jgi:hypothetical protein
MIILGWEPLASKPRDRETIAATGLGRIDRKTKKENLSVDNRIDQV